MKRGGRYAMGKRNAVAKITCDDADIHRVPWHNPLQGDPRKVAMAEVKVKQGGLFVGFRMRF